MAARARLIAVAALAAAGCRHPKPACAPDLPAAVELRDAAGALELALRAPPTLDPPQAAGTRDVCDGSGRLLARLAEAPGRAELVNAAGDPLAVAEAHPGDDATLTLFDPGRDAAASGPLRLHDQDGLLRLLARDGVPVAQLARADGKSIALDAGGTPQATAERAESRLVLRGRDGAVRRYVLGLTDERAAAAFALDQVPLPTRLALARFLDTPR